MRGVSIQSVLLVLCAASACADVDGNTASSLHSDALPLTCSAEKTAPETRICRALLSRPVSWQISNEPDIRPVRVPGYWPVQARGVFHYRTQLALPEIPPAWNALWFHEIPSAAVVYWNGQEIGRAGTPGSDRSSEIPHIAPFLVRLPALHGRTAVLEIHVSNFHARAGGILGVEAGDADYFQRRRTFLVMQESATAGIILFISLFFLGAAVWEKRPAPAWFSLFAFLAVCRTAGSNGLFEEIGLGGSFADVRLVLEYLGGAALSPAAFFLFLRGFFPRTFGGARLTSAVFRSLGRWFVLPAGAALTLWILVVRDASVYGAEQPAMVFGYLAPCVLVNLGVILRAAYLREPGAAVVVAGGGILALCSLHDLFVQAQGTPRVLLASQGLLALVVSLGAAVLLERRQLSSHVAAARKEIMRRHAELVSAQEQKDQFLLETSGGLQNPLNAILKSTLSLVEDPAARLSSENRLKLMETADQAARILDDFRRVAQCLSVPSGAGQIQETNVSLLVRREMLLHQELTGRRFAVTGPHNIHEAVNAAGLRWLLGEIFLQMKQVDAPEADVHISQGPDVRIQIEAPTKAKTSVRGTLSYALSRNMAEKSGIRFSIVEEEGKIRWTIALPPASDDGRRKQKAEWFAEEAQRYFAASQ